MAEKYAWEQKNNPAWPYWIVEFNQGWNNVWRYFRACLIEETQKVNDSFYRTVPVTEEYYYLITSEV